MPDAAMGQKKARGSKSRTKGKKKREFRSEEEREGSMGRRTADTSEGKG